MTTTINASTAAGGGLIQTADSSGILALQTANTTAVTIDASQNVGVGTTSPISLVTLYSSTNATQITQGDSTTYNEIRRYSTDASGPYFFARKSRGSVASPSAVASGDVAGEYLFGVYGGTTNRTIARIRGTVDTYTSDTDISGYLSFYTSPTGTVAPAERMRIDQAGNVGIGANPAVKLDVAGSNQTTIARTYAGATSFTQYIDDTAGGVYLAANTASGTAAKFLAFQTVPSGGSATERMRIDSSGNVGVSTSSPSTYFPTYYRGVATQISDQVTTIGSYYQGGTGQYGVIKSTNGAGTGNLALTFAGGSIEYGRFDTSGYLLVGTTSNAQNADVGIKLRPTGQGANSPDVSIVTSATANSSSSLSIYSTGAAAYRFYVGNGGTISATSTTITGISDQRLKENIRDLDDGLEKVMALQPRKFDWKEGKGQNIKDARGFIAQEFETVFPDMIEEWIDPAPEGEEPYKAVNANLIPTLVKAIQELNTKLEAQAAEIAALKGAQA